MKPQRLRVAAYALIHHSNRLLLCRLSKEIPQWEGYWTLPGGGLNFGESPEKAAIREVEEETGLLIEVKSVATIDSIFGTSAIEDVHSIRIIYHADIIGGYLRHETSGSTDCCDWHELPSPRVKLVDLAEVGLRAAQKMWPSPHPIAGR